MPRKPIKKELQNTRLLKEYASWAYCGSCGSTVAYLCYVTYDRFEFEYKCKCQDTGHIYIEFENGGNVAESRESLLIVKNRLCCRKDQSPLLSLVTKNLLEYKLSVVCNQCNTQYRMEG